ncbi:hypothetical protein QFZ55_004551 [Streptomyces luteogriseus]|nr:hypothetical protein [Streptomyces luteogriseus]
MTPYHLLLTVEHLPLRPEEAPPSPGSLPMAEIVAAGEHLAVPDADDQVKNLKTVGDAVDHIVTQPA